MAYWDSNNYDGRYLRLSISESVDTINNRSTLYWTLSSVGGAVNYYTIGATNVTINGTSVYSKAQTSWDAKVFPAAKGSVSGSLTVNHNSGGDKTITVSFTTSVYIYQPLEYGGNMTLTNIDRAAPSISISTSGVTANSVNLSVTASTTCDIWQYSKDGGSSWTTFNSSAGTSKSTTISGLTPNTTYSIKARARKQSNQVYGTSGAASVKTLGGSVIGSIGTVTADAATVNISLSATVYNTSYQHTLTIKNGSTTVLTISSLALSNGSNTITLNSTQRTTVLAAMASIKSFSGTFTLTTYSGSTQIGNASSKTATVQTTATNSSPTFTAFTYSDTNATTAGVTGNNQILIAGISTLQIIATAATAKNGASISSYSVIAGERTAASVNTTLNVGTIDATGTVPVSVTAVDTRGYTTTVTKNITVVEYERIDITTSTMRRVNEVENITKIVISGSLSEVIISSVNKNAFSFMRYRYKITSESSYSAWVSLSPTTTDTSFSYTNNEFISLNADYSYYVQVQVGDLLTTDTVTVTIPQGTPLLSFRKKKVGINNRSPGSALDVSGDIKMNGVFVLGYVGTITTGDNFNDYKAGGVYNYTGSGADNAPGAAGMLEVISTSNSFNLIQRFTEFSSSCRMWVRSYFNNTTWTEWTLK